MSEEMFSSEVHKHICEAFNCNAIATREISVKAGNHGIISLSLCEQCVNKFRVEGTTK